MRRNGGKKIFFVDKNFQINYQAVFDFNRINFYLVHSRPKKKLETDLKKLLTKQAESFKRFRNFFQEILTRK